MNATVSKGAHTMLKVELWQQYQAENLGLLLLLLSIGELFALTFLVLINKLFALLLKLSCVSNFICYK